MTGSLDGPLKPHITLPTLNVQFLSVADSCTLEQVADVSPLTAQLPQSEVMTYCTDGQLESSWDQLNVSSPGRTLIRLMPVGAR